MNPLTYNDLRPGDMLYVPPDALHGYLIFVESRMDYFLFIQVWSKQIGYPHAASRRKIPKESVGEGDLLIEDSGWSVYRP